MLQRKKTMLKQNLCIYVGAKINHVKLSCKQEVRSKKGLLKLYMYNYVPCHLQEQSYEGTLEKDQLQNIKAAT